jgi:tetratricopeptide (TPR) repeat protein
LFQPDSLLAFLLYGIAFFLSFYFLTEEDLPALARLFLGGMALATVINLLEIFGVFWLPWSFTKTSTFNTFDTAFGWAVMMASSLTLMAALWLRGLNEKRDKIYIGVVAVLMFLGLLVVNFELIWIGLVVMMLALGAWFASRENFRIPFLFVVFAMCMAILGSKIPPLGSIPSEVRPNLSSSVAVAIHAAHGWRIPLGAGPSTFGEQFTRFREQNLNLTNFWNNSFVQGYDFFITLFASVGILGLLAFVAIIILFVREAIRKRPEASGKIVGIFAVSLFLSLFFYQGFFVLMVYLFIALGLFLRNVHADGKVSLDGLRPAILFGFFAVIAALVAGAFAGAYAIGTQYVAAAEYENGITELNANDLSAATQSIQRSLAVVPDSDDAWVVASQIAFASGEQAFTAAGGTLNSQAQGSIASAVQAAQQAVALDRNNVLNWENLGNIYQNLIPVAGGADALARAAYQSAEAIDPQNPDLPIDIAQVDVAVANKFSVASDAADAQKALADAETELNASLALKPDYASPLTMLAQIDLQQGATAKAIREISEVANANPLDSGMAFQLGILLYQNNQTAAAQTQFERAVALESNYSNARYFLGLIYDSEGMTSAALSQFQAIAQLNPGNTEIKQIITNLQNGKPALASITAASSTAPSLVTSTSTTDKKK